MKPNILDGLAWAGISEQARVARISAGLVRELSRHKPTHTKTRIREAVRATSPRHGRGKAIAEAVTLEYQRQAPIYQERHEQQMGWQRRAEHLAKRSTRLNRAYAAAFNRPVHRERQYAPSHLSWDDRRAWEAAENARPKGDNCIALTHQDEHVVCLLTSHAGLSGTHIATRCKRGEIVRTFLRGRADNLVEAAVDLGGYKVKTALSKGKRVKTDWVGRRSFIYHDGSDHERPKVEEIAWETQEREYIDTQYGQKVRYINTLTLGDSVQRVPTENQLRQ